MLLIEVNIGLLSAALRLVTRCLPWLPVKTSLNRSHTRRFSDVCRRSSDEIKCWTFCSDQRWHSRILLPVKLNDIASQDAVTSRIASDIVECEGEGPFRGVIDMFGGVGGLVEFRSSLLASRGFACLALAYFAYDDLPSLPIKMDLKYFEEAAQFLCDHPKVSGDGVGVVAICKGAEMALAMASYLPQVTATVCINGPNALNGNSLVYGDVLVNGIPYKMEKIQSTDFWSLSLTNAMGDPRKPENQDSIIPLEKARGPILFLVGNKDQHYDSLFFAREAKSRAEKYGKKDVYVQCYPGAGHLLEPPGSPFCPASKSPHFSLPLTWGGDLLPHCRAQETSWKALQEYFHRNISCSRQNKL
ncbi:unnamed protein product [Ranitomeya imitator]|uniref:BAAT/Acyl-CoA thioester hydrolase C-terminal domain-containing protein n=1 Tax=Ranitomeya imitator TaxID=111125 RepID=A0ABN9KY13_9NEOB|nr:unnamed protein product [Ranitomeya imitator]